MKQTLTLTATLLATYLNAHASANEAADSTRHLDEIVVTASRPGSDVIPAQTLSGEELKGLNSNSVADALRYFSGVQVKDYGGVGGIKTVNIRRATASESIIFKKRYQIFRIPGSASESLSHA